MGEDRKLTPEEALEQEIQSMGRACTLVDHAYAAGCLVIVYEPEPHEPVVRLGTQHERRVATYRPDGTQVSSGIVETRWER